MKVDDTVMPAWLETLPRYRLGDGLLLFDGPFVRWADLVQACPPYDEEAMMAQRTLGHGEGQQHAIDDVNAGRVDDLIQARLQACPPTRPLQHELLDLIKLMPDSQVDEILSFVATLREARLAAGYGQACPPPSEALNQLSKAVMDYLVHLNADIPLDEEFRTKRARVVTLACNLILPSASPSPPGEKP